MLRKVNPLIYVAILLALILVGVLLLCQPGKAQEPDPIATPTPAYTVYLPFVANWTYPWETFAKVGSVANYAGFNGMSGKAIVAGLQTLAVLMNSDGTTSAEIWLCKWPDLETPVWIVGELDQRVYDHEWLWVTIPWWLYDGSADTIVIFGTGPYFGLLASGQFIK